MADILKFAPRMADNAEGRLAVDKLLDAAEKGQLSAPEVLGAQIDRMLNDPRSSRFCDACPAQWLQLDRLVTSIPDPKMFSYFSCYKVYLFTLMVPLAWAIPESTSSYS